MQNGAPEPPRHGPLRNLIGITRWLIFDQHTRRLVMFYAVLAALLMTFSGDIFFAGWLRESVRRFLVYWLVVAWLTMLAALLAIYDLLLLRAAHRAERRRLQKEMLPEERLKAIELAARQKADRD